MGLSSKQRDDIFFKTNKGTYIKLSFVKSEYKAFKQSGQGWVQMNLGGCREEALMQYIKEKY